MNGAVNTRGQIALYAVGAVAATALSTSVFPLWVKGAPVGLAIAAALPPSLLLGIIGLASRYLCRAMPLASSSRGSIPPPFFGSAPPPPALWGLTCPSCVRVFNPP